MGVARDLGVAGGPAVRVIAGLLAAGLLLALPAAASEIGDDGLHKEDWFSLTFKDVAEDLESARSQGKRLAIIFEQRGCIYCAKVHEEVFSDPQVRDYIKQHYEVVQYDLHGAAEVTDLDGEVLTEKQAARKWGVIFTPTVIFLPEEANAGESVGQAAVSVMPGAFGRHTSLHMYEWVAEKGYEGDEHFQNYHARRLREDGIIGPNAE
ncbi:thioredoxin family protein [Microbaculum marinum]|uniref:Thioredoxin family protein n=1 Tax=Microbaculum marinum TaxID=1764581 RepID=A0AAW9RUH2_9HYPH